MRSADENWFRFKLFMIGCIIVLVTAIITHSAIQSQAAAGAP
jgi:hypothetical protein